MTETERRRSGARIGAIGAALGFGALAGWWLHRQPKWILRGLSALSPDVLYFVETDESAVAITIDDGPSRRSMPRILDLLAEHDAKATFFLISDHVPGSEDLVDRAVAEGHEIGNHMTSDRMSLLLSPAGFERDLLAAEAVLAHHAPLRWFRPGSGLYNRRMLSTARRHGYRTALGSIYPMDSRIPSVRYATHRVVAHIEPGFIVMLHDGPTRGPRTASVLERALPVLRGRGLRMLTLSELENLDRRGPDRQPVAGSAKPEPIPTQGDAHR